MVFLLLMPLFEKPIRFFKKLKLKIFGKVQIGNRVTVQNNFYITVQNHTNVNKDETLDGFLEIPRKQIETIKEPLKLPGANEDPGKENQSE